jgi:hypothetical protein
VGRFAKDLSSSVADTAGRAIGWGIAAATFLLIGYFAYSSLTGPPTHGSGGDGELSARPTFLRETDSTSSGNSPSGSQPSKESQTENADPVGTVTIVDTAGSAPTDTSSQSGSSGGSSSGTSRSRSIRVWQTDFWFPEWGKPEVQFQLQGVSRSNVRWTPESRPFLAWDPNIGIGIGASFAKSGPIGVRISSSPVVVADRIYLGGYLHVPTNALKSSRIGLKAGTLLRKNLQVSLGINYNREPSLSVTYRF